VAIEKKKGRSSCFDLSCFSLRILNSPRLLCDLSMADVDADETQLLQENVEQFSHCCLPPFVYSDLSSGFDLRACPA